MKAELLILGALHRGNLHPYEIKRRLTNAMVECFTEVDVGTLYYAVRQLAKAGMIAAVSRQRVSPGGTRTVYRLTPKGRERFRELLDAQFAADGSVADTLYTAMLFLHWSDLPAVAKRLREKLRKQEELIAEAKALQIRFAPILSTGTRHLLRHIEAVRRLDRKWLQKVLVDVEAGRVEDMTDPSRLAPQLEPQAPK